MASDSDGRNSSIVILGCIREKLVEYKNLLLRQLLDEQEAALAARKKIVPEDVEDNRDNSVAEQKSPIFEGDWVRQEEEAVADVVADAVADVVADALKLARRKGHCSDSSIKSLAFADEPQKTIFEKISEDAVLKKRRLAKTEVKGAAHAEKKAKRSKLNSEKNSDGLKKHSDAKEEKPKNALESAEDRKDQPQGTPYRVARTSVPPKKYLIQKRREEEASDREAARQEQHSFLLASPATRKGVICTKRSVLTPTSSSVSVDLTNAEFGRRLSEYVRLYREVNKRSRSVTRKRQLPRLPTPACGETHWDFLLEEMKWTATDFAQERNWKRVLQHRLAADVIIAQDSGSVRLELENRQMARGVALQVSAFWRTMERIAARSRVRFEAAGTDRSDHGAIGDTASAGPAAIIEGDSKQAKTEDVEMGGIVNDTLALKYHTNGVAGSSVIDAKCDGKKSARPQAVLTSAKAYVTYIVSAGKRARSAMTSLSTKGADVTRSSARPLREAAFRDLQARCTALQAEGGPIIILATFQLLALRWMLDLYSSDLNMFLNDQLGMGKAATIVAFLSLIEIVSSQNQRQEDGLVCTSKPEQACAEKSIGPHLIVVSEEELHKWRHYLRVWHPDRRIQLYDGFGKTSRYKEQLQREWNIKLRAQAHRDEDDFLVAPPNNDDDEGLDDDECTQPIYCVLCPVGAFAEDRQAFVAFAYWQMVIVENEHGGYFDDSTCVHALQQLRQQQRRVLCNGQSIENWKDTALRLQYAEFIVREASALNISNANESCEHRVEAWPLRELQVERSSVAEVMQIYGKSSSVRAALWKASSQQEDLPKYMNALLLALSCLSLRRVRSEVETELRKIEEISLSCQLTLSQSTQYRNALSGFAATQDTASGREEQLSVWLQLLLRLRQICNCVDLVNDMDKLGHADLRLLTSCSAKLEALEPLLRRLALQEGKKVVIYCQFHGMFPVLELFLSLLGISYVRIAGSIAMQRRALCHFADRTVVRVALASTRLSTSNGGQAVSVFGSEAIVVVDSDWNATCDAKLRASWAKMAVGGADALSVYRLHCENTVEASLLRVGASLTEKVFGEISPQELLAVPSDMALIIGKPSWWSSTVTSSGGNGLTAIGPMVKLASVAREVERNEKYCGGSSELEAPLIVHNVDLDAEEHLLLANTDELTPVEWYAVNYVHGVTDKNQQQGSEAQTIERETGSVGIEGTALCDARNAFFQSDQCSFEKLAAAEVNRHWQQGDAVSQLFFDVESHHNGGVCETALEKKLMQMRTQGMETHFDIYKSPQLRLLHHSKSRRGAFSSGAGMSIDTQMTFRVSYRVSAPPPPLLQTGKLKAEHVIAQLGDLSKLTKSSKKLRPSAAAMTAARGGLVSGSISMNLPANSADDKRKLESQLSGIKLGPRKERRVDLEGIPVPDVSELADDDFWGDTNLDALDSAEWDDPALLGGILDVGVGGIGTGSSYTTSSSCTAFNGTGASTALGASGMPVSAIEARADLGHSKIPFQKSSKKLKTGTGRVRKSSMSSFDSGRDAWSAHDDLILKKLFELYGTNWTLIAQVLYSTTAVSRFVCKKRSPRQCYDRYGKIVSGSLSMASCGPFATKDGKSTQRAASIATTHLTPAVLDTRIGLARSELLLKFPPRHSLPGLPPPSIMSASSLVEAHRQNQITNDADAYKKLIYTDTGGMDDLKSIRTSFDAIIQCMKHKTSPPPIPIPVGTDTTIPGSTATPAARSSTDLGTKASLTAASFPSSQASTPASAPSTPTKANAKDFKKAIVPPAAAAKAIPGVVPLPHKSYTDMVSLLPEAVLGPDEIIKRSKEAAMVAVQAAAAVVSVGREGSPLSASGDVMLGAGSGFGVSVSSSMPRRSHAASITSELGAVSVMSISTVPSTGVVNGDTVASAASAGAQSQTTAATTTATWGGIVQDVSANGLNAGLASAANGSELQRNSPIPVTTSTLLHVLDRMPEIKNKIQSILNRTDCSESQKVAMIARLLSNTNAINNTNALGTSAPMTSPDASAADSSAVLVALTTDPGMLSSSDMLIDTETPLPMPASLSAEVPNVVGTSSALTPQGQRQPSAK